MVIVMVLGHSWHLGVVGICGIIRHGYAVLYQINHIKTKVTNAKVSHQSQLKRK